MSRECSVRDLRVETEKRPWRTADGIAIKLRGIRMISLWRALWGTMSNAQISFFRTRWQMDRPEVWVAFLSLTRSDSIRDPRCSRRGLDERFGGWGQRGLRRGKDDESGSMPCH